MINNILGFFSSSVSFGQKRKEIKQKTIALIIVTDHELGKYMKENSKLGFSHLLCSEIKEDDKIRNFTFFLFSQLLSYQTCILRKLRSVLPFLAGNFKLNFGRSAVTQRADTFLCGYLHAGRYLHAFILCNKGLQQIM